MFNHINEFEWPLLLWQISILVFFVFIVRLLYLGYKFLKKDR
jgi:membrane protein implicated in regulation of membrane protease activity